MVQVQFSKAATPILQFHRRLVPGLSDSIADLPCVIHSQRFSANLHDLTSNIRTSQRFNGSARDLTNNNTRISSPSSSVSPPGLTSNIRTSHPSGRSSASPLDPTSIIPTNNPDKASRWTRMRTRASPRNLLLLSRLY